MKEQFVPFHLAVKMKELGFNETCAGGYDYSSENKDPEFKLLIFSTNNDKEWYDKRKQIPSPLWQQAFDWFRLNHDMTVTINLHLHYYKGDIFETYYGQYMKSNASTKMLTKLEDNYNVAREKTLENIIKSINNNK